MSCRYLYLFGFPISASPSPILHNTGFASKNLDFEYKLCQTQDIENVVNTLRDPTTFGGSVTIPHKMSIVPFLDHLSDSATAIGAVNTVWKENGRLMGDNTDWMAIYDLTRDKLGSTNVSKSLALVVGAGGTAHAACFALLKLGIPFVIWNRTPETAEVLAKRFGGSPCTDLKKIQEIDVVISTVPPVVDFVLPAHLLRSSLVVVELVYNPRCTKLVQQAKEYGCKLVDGSEILFRQGIRQFEIWTKLKAPEKEMAYALVHKHNDGALVKDIPETLEAILTREG
eukprot:TRINITY_DN723_c0_g2_i7.p1 TRINITY_DN723_c0_g2~~TRINITY_DN723_c0_g2_i7.p1  ORF type:complete len:333 (+),score=71.08 TRINITY_DN723_c0_g2_i7:148-999(+)